MSLLYIIFIQLSSLFLFSFRRTSHFLYFLSLSYVLIIHHFVSFVKTFFIFFIFLLCGVVANITADNISKVKCVIIIFKTANFFVSSIEYIIHTHYLFLSLNPYLFDNYNYTTSEPKVNSFLKVIFLTKSPFVWVVFPLLFKRRKTFVCVLAFAVPLVHVFCELFVHFVATNKNIFLNHCVTQCRVFFYIIRIVCNKCVNAFC